MRFHYVLLTAAAATLLAGQASAQSPSDPAPPTQTTTPSGPINPNQKRSTFDKNDEVRASEQEMMDANTGPAAMPMTDNNPADQVAYATGETTVVTNGPVLDTAENRAKYPPQSRAGKRTAAAGN
jgi:hypothetical protein